MTINEKEMLNQQAREFWNSFVVEVTNHNRFQPKHPLPLFIKDYLNTHTTYMESGTILYRARIIDWDKPDAKKTGIIRQYVNHEDYGDFEGFDEQRSFVPPADFVPSGRANPEKIVYLYAATETITAIGETRPRIQDDISVAKIEILRKIKLADLTQKIASNTESLDELKIAQITHAFSHPCKDPVEYIPTQYIAEYIKNLGYDGILFRSSFVPDGTNVTIFHPGVAKAIASAPYKIDSIAYYARRTGSCTPWGAFEIMATNDKRYKNKS